ncbi:MAG: class I SAM-dependent methyltransferase [Bacteroidota bacterium]
MREWIKSKLNWHQRRFIRNSADDFKALFHKKRLSELGKIYRTDKAGVHGFAQLYQQHFKSFRNKRIRMLEIGVGGYDSQVHGGESLRMWKSYFNNGRIYSIDYYDKSRLQEPRIQIFKCSQVDFPLLGNINSSVGPFDIIIDDGSHQNEHVIETFKFLFPQLKDGGIYVVEDIQTSYWPEFGGNSQDLLNAPTIMNFFKAFADGLNYKEFIRPGYQPSYFDLNVTSIHFYHNIIFIYKGKNENPSNLIVDNKWLR